MEAEELTKAIAKALPETTKLAVNGTGITINVNIIKNSDGVAIGNGAYINADNAALLALVNELAESRKLNAKLLDLLAMKTGPALDVLR